MLGFVLDRESANSSGLPRFLLALYLRVRLVSRRQPDDMTKDNRLVPYRVCFFSRPTNRSQMAAIIPTASPCQKTKDPINSHQVIPSRVAFQHPTFVFGGCGTTSWWCLPLILHRFESKAVMSAPCNHPGASSSNKPLAAASVPSTEAGGASQGMFSDYRGPELRENNVPC